MKRAILAFTLALFMATPALAAPEDSPSAFAMTGDLVVARPLGLAMTAIGTAVFVVSLPFSALGGNVGDLGLEALGRLDPAVVLHQVMRREEAGGAV